jgi:hypothetical protein
MSFFPELEGLNLTQLIDQFEIPAHPSGSLFYDEVAQRIRQHGDMGIGVLLGKMSKARMNQLRGVITWLTYSLPEQVELQEWLRGKLYEYLQDRHPLIIMDAVDGLRIMGDKTIRKKILALRKHPSPYVRGAVLRYITELAPTTAPTLLIAALRDAHHIVRECAIDGLDDLRKTSAVSRIRPLLKDRHPHVRQAAETAIRNLTDN